MIHNHRPTPWALVTMLAVQGVLAEAHGQEAQIPDSMATVRGLVLEHETGRGLEGAIVTLAPEEAGLQETQTRISEEDGAFFFPSVLPGVYRLSASLLGYTDLQDTLIVQVRSDVALTLPLSASPLRLEPIVVVVDRRPVGPLQAFERRRRLVQRGTFLTRQAIERSNSQQFTDLLRGVPGVRLLQTSSFGNTVYFRGGCTPDLWVDGAQVGTTTDIDSFLRPQDLEAVEVYRGPDLPGEFGTNLCGAIVAWTKRGFAVDEAAGNRSLLKQLTFAGSFVLVIVGIRVIG